MEKMLSDVLLENLDFIKAKAATLVRSIADIEDLTQDLAEKVLKNDVPASKIERPLAYFSKIMRNQRFDDLKAQKHESITPIERIDLYSAIEDVESIAEYNRVRTIVQKEFASLAPEMQEAFLMVYYDGFSLDETAKKIGVESNTLSQRFRRFRQRLTKKLNAESITISMVLMIVMNLG